MNSYFENRLKEAVSAFENDKSQNGYDRLLGVLCDGLMNCLDIELPIRNGNVPVCLKAPDGRYYYAVFTDKTKIPDGVCEGYAEVNMAKFFTMINSDAECGGIVFDPFGASCTVSKTHLGSLIESSGMEYDIEADKKSDDDDDDCRLF